MEEEGPTFTAWRQTAVGPLMSHAVSTNADTLDILSITVTVASALSPLRSHSGGNLKA